MMMLFGGARCQDHHRHTRQCFVAIDDRGSASNPSSRGISISSSVAPHLVSPPASSLTPQRHRARHAHHSPHSPAPPPQHGASRWYSSPPPAPFGIRWRGCSLALVGPGGEGAVLPPSASASSSAISSTRNSPSIRHDARATHGLSSEVRW